MSQVLDQKPGPAIAEPLLEREILGLALPLDSRRPFADERKPPRTARTARRGPAPYVLARRKVGRNDPCPCGSGTKYKRCCLPAGDPRPQRERAA